MRLEELEALVGAGEIDTVLLALTDMQGRLQGKRLTARHFLEEVTEHGAEGCNYLLAVDVEMNTVEGYRMASWDRGYGDFTMRPDLATLRLVPWQEGTALCLCDLAWEDGSPVVASPRQVLIRQYLSPTGDTYWMQRESAPTATTSTKKAVPIDPSTLQCSASARPRASRRSKVRYCSQGTLLERNP